MFFVVVDFFGLLRQQIGTLFLFMAFYGNRLVLCFLSWLLRQQIGTLLLFVAFYGNRLVLCTATDWCSVSFRGLLRQQIGTLFPFVAFYGNRLVLCLFFRGLLRQQIGTLYSNRLVLCFFSWPSTARNSLLSFLCIFENTYID